MSAPVSTRSVRSLEGDTLDLVVWRELGARRGVLERVAELNPQLRRLPLKLPTGTEVFLPTEAPTEDAPAKIRRFWS